MRRIAISVWLFAFLAGLAIPPALAAYDNPVVRGGVITNKHGSYPNTGLADPNRTHVGIDIAAGCGSKVYAYADGVVSAVVNDEGDWRYQAGKGKGNLGYAVAIQHPTGANTWNGRPFSTVYLHLSAPPRLEVGDEVTGGETIGRVGKTPNWDGCHTHFEVRNFDDAVEGFWNPRWGITTASGEFRRNIYGEGDQRQSKVFLDDWEDPQVLFATIQTAQSGATAPIHECDRLAGHPLDPQGVARWGGFWESLDTNKAIPACEIAVSRFPDSPRYQFQLGRALQKAGRLDEAVTWYEKSARNSYAAADVNLARFYARTKQIPEDYNGLPKDYNKAMELLAHANDLGHPLAPNYLGNIHLLGLYGVEKNVNEGQNLLRIAFTRVRELSERGNPAAHLQIGRYFERGRGAKKDLNEAKKFYEKAVEGGYQEAQVYLDRVLAKLETSQAVDWEKKQAEEFSHRDTETPVPIVMELTPDSARQLIKHATRFPEPVADGFSNIRKTDPIVYEVERMIREGYFVCRQSILGDFSVTKKGEYLVKNCVWNSSYKKYAVTFYTHKLEIRRIVDILTDESTGTAEVTYEVGLAEAPYLQRLREIDPARVKQEFGGQDIETVRELRKAHLKKWDQGWRVK